MKRNIVGFSCIVCLVLAYCNPFYSQTAKAVVTDYHQNNALNGAVLIVKEGRIVCDTVLGYADFKSNRKLTKETAFYAASLAKPVTAIGIMQLQQKHLLSDEDTIGKYLDGLPAGLQPITIRLADKRKRRIDVSCISYRY